MCYSRGVNLKRTKISKWFAQHSLWHEIIKYSISGGAFFWSGYILFALLYSGLGISVGPAKIISYIFGLSVNFILVRWWVFRAKHPVKNLPTVSGRYIFLSAVNLGIDYAIVVGLAGLGITPYIGQFVSSGFFTIWNFVIYKFWVFAPHTQIQKAEDRR